MKIVKRYAILDATVEPKKLFYASNELDEIDKRSIEPGMPAEWYVLDLVNKEFIADEYDGWYDSEFTQIT